MKKKCTRIISLVIVVMFFFSLTEKSSEALSTDNNFEKCSYEIVIENIIKNGSFEDGGTYWSGDESPVISTNYSLFGNYSLLKGNDTGTNGNTMQYLNPSLFITGHKYYCSSYVYKTTDAPVNTGSVFTQTWDVLFEVTSGYGVLNEWIRRSTIYTYDGTAMGTSPWFDLWTNATSQSVFLDGIVLIDLTDTFGAGSEPTQAWCDENINYDTASVTCHETLIANQATNGSFENNATGWDDVGATHELSISTTQKLFGDYAIKVTAAGSWEAYYEPSVSTSIIIGHIYYCQINAYVTSYFSGHRGCLWSPKQNGIIGNINPAILNNWQKVSTYGVAISSAHDIRIGHIFDETAEWTAYLDGLLIVDLTAAFGAGNEPTQAWCDDNFDYETTSVIDQYTINFATNGGTSIDSMTLDYGSIITAPTSPIKEEHTFQGWYYDINFTKPVSWPITLGDNDIVLYAKWSLNQYTVSFEANGGSSVNNMTLDYNSTFYAPNQPTRIGYVFQGWYYDTELTEPVSWPFTLNNGDLTLYASWSVNSSTLLIQNIVTNATDSEITLMWNDNEAADYFEIEIDGQQIITVYDNRYIYDNLEPGTTHSFRIRSKMDEISGSWSESVQVTTIPCVKDINVVAACTSISLSWEVVSLATSYDIEVDGAIITSITDTTYTISGLVPGTQHMIRIRCRIGSYTYSWSEYLLEITGSTAPETVSTIISSEEDTSVTFTWNEALDAEEYVAELIGVQSMVCSGNSCTFYGLSPDTTYSFQVKASNIIGDSPWSNTVSATTKLLATPQYLIAVPASDSISLSWSEVDGATSYQVEADGNIIDTTSLPTYTHTGLSSETRVIYRIKAISASGESAWSCITSAETLPVPPDVPQGLTAVASKDTITLSWSAVTGITGYNVEVDGAVIDNGTAATYTDEKLDPFTTHTYRVRAINESVESDWSYPITVTTAPGSPRAPEDIYVTNTRSSAIISWESIGGAVSYDLEIFDGTNTSVINNITGTTYTHRRAATGIEYVYRIRCTNIYGASEWSGHVINNSMRAVGKKGTTFDLGLTGSDVMDFSKYTMEVTYDPMVVDVSNLCKASPTKVLEAGQIEGTNITIVSFTPGRIIFTVDKVVRPNESWTGVLNSIEFLPKLSGGTYLTFTVVENQ